MNDNITFKKKEMIF